MDFKRYFWTANRIVSKTMDQVKNADPGKTANNRRKKSQLGINPEG